MKMCNSRLQEGQEETLKQEETSKQKNNEKFGSNATGNIRIFTPREVCFDNAAQTLLERLIFLML